MDQQFGNALTGMELDYAFAKGVEYEVMGSNTGPFVLHSKLTLSFTYLVANDRSSIPHL
jgi:hypothetical protein